MDRVMDGPIIGRPGLLELSADEIALRSELEAHHAESYGWALCCCRRRREEAENVLQIVYLKVLRRRAVFDGRSSFRTWLFSVIRHTAAGERRTELFRRLRLKEFFTRQAMRKGEPSGEDLASSSEIHERLSRALLKLPLRQREVLHLVFYHELSLQEAAKVMCVSVGSARTHYERGKGRMRRELEAGGKP